MKNLSVKDVIVSDDGSVKILYKGGTQTVELISDGEPIAVGPIAVGSILEIRIGQVKEPKDGKTT